MYNLTHLFLLAFFGSIIALAGGVVFLFSKTLSGFLQKHSVPFAAGVLITVSLLALIPESFEQIGEQTFLVVLLSFFTAFLFEHFIIHIHHHSPKQHDQSHHDGVHPHSVPLVIIGDTIHNFIDGIAIAASFFVNPGLGFVTAFSTFLHEIPHEVSDFAILLKAGYSRRKVLIVNAISASFTIVGAFLAVGLAENHAFVGIMLAISAGIFLYLGAIDFLPNMHQGYKSKVQSIIPLIIGILCMYITLTAVPHSH